MRALRGQPQSYVPVERFGASRRQTRSRSLTPSEIDAGYGSFPLESGSFHLFSFLSFLMMSVTSRSPLSILNVPLRPGPPVENTLRKTRRFEGGLARFLRRARRAFASSSTNSVVSSPDSESAPTNRRNTACFSIVGKTIVPQHQFQFQPRCTTMSMRSCERAIQRVWPRVFSVDQTEPTTSIQIRLPDGSRDPCGNSAPSVFRRCVSGPSPYPCGRLPMTSLSHIQLLLDLPDLFIYSTVLR